MAGQDTQHGSRAGGIVGGLVFALLINGALAAGIVLATQLKTDAIAAEADAAAAETFHCRYIDQGRFVNVEVEAEDWQSAEKKVCGVEYSDVRVPPLLARGYSHLIDDPASDPFLMAQRESCSCSEDEMPAVLENVALVEAPKLGTKKKQRALPRIVNNPEKIEHNAVNPDIDPKPRKKKKEPKRKRKKRHEPDLDKLKKHFSENPDEARPTNQDQETGVEWGSRSGKGEGKGPLFLQKVKAKLDNHMRAPSSIPKSQLKGMKARATIKIGANGKIWSWSFRSKSGNKAFDDMVERTLKRFEISGDLGFPAPPEGYVLKPIPIKVDGSRID